MYLCCCFLWTYYYMLPLTLHCHVIDIILKFLHVDLFFLKIIFFFNFVFHLLCTPEDKISLELLNRFYVHHCNLFSFFSLQLIIKENRVLSRCTKLLNIFIWLQSYISTFQCSSGGISFKRREIWNSLKWKRMKFRYEKQRKFL